MTEYYFPTYTTSAAASYGPIEVEYVDCFVCKKRMKSHEGILVRTNNEYLPNSDTDKWEYQCKSCMTDAQREELNPPWLKDRVC